MRGLRFALLFEAAVGVVALIAAWVLGVSVGPTLGLDWSGVLFAACGVGLLLLLFTLTMRSTWPPFQRIRGELGRLLDLLFGTCGPAGLLAVSIMAGISEELLFRAVIQQSIAAHLSTVAALIVTNLVFALAHAITPTYAVLAFAMGTVLSLVFLLSGSLIAAALTHAIYDFVALLIYRSQKGSSAEGYRA